MMDGFPLFGTIIGIVVIVAAVLSLLSLIANLYKTPKTNEAIVVSGSTNKTDRGLRVLTTRGGIVWPIVNKAVSISLKSHQIATECRAVSQNKIEVLLRVVATFKVGGTDEEIRKAAQRFAQQEDKIDGFVKETIEGSMRAIVGNMTVESLLSDRKKLSDELREEISESMMPQGLALDTLQIQDISDEKQYIINLGKPEEARVKQLAAVAEAEADKTARQAQIEAQKQVAISEKEYKLQQAAINEETSRREAEANAAKPIAEAEQQKNIAAAQREVELANVEVTKAKLQSEVNAKADADKYKRTVDAQAEAAAHVETAKGQATAQAEAAKGAAAAQEETARGNAEARKLNADGDAIAIQKTAEAEAKATEAKAAAAAKAIELEGAAKAAAIKAQGLAEAEAMQKKADAYKQYGQAALQSLIIEKLPAIADSVSKHLEGAKITAVNTDATDQITGLTGNVAAKVPEIVKTLTGLDIAKSLRGLAGDAADGDGDAAETVTAEVVPDATARKTTTAGHHTAGKTGTGQSHGTGK